jgi:dUTPase
MKLKITKLTETAKVEVKENRIELFSQQSKMLPMFNNLANEIAVSARLEKVVVEIPTGISIELEDKKTLCIPKFILDKKLDKLGIKLYNSSIENGEIKFLMQNLSNTKIAITQNTHVGSIVFVPILSIESKIEEYTNI